MNWYEYTTYKYNSIIHLGLIIKYQRNSCNLNKFLQHVELLQVNILD